MKLATIQSAISLCPCDPVTMGNAARDFESFAPLHFRSNESLSRLTNEGFLTAETVSFNGVASFVVWWTRTLDGDLFVNACQSLKNSACPVDAAFIAAEKIRQRENLRATLFASAREGLLRKAASCGFEFHRIVMRKG